MDMQPSVPTNNIVRVEDSTLTFLKEKVYGRLLHAVKNKNHNDLAQCGETLCNKFIKGNTEEFIGVAFAYDPKLFTTFCVPCGVAKGWVVNPNLPVLNKEEGSKKKKRGRTQETETTPNIKEEEDKDMGVLSLKDKLAAKTKAKEKAEEKPLKMEDDENEGDEGDEDDEPEEALIGDEDEDEPEETPPPKKEKKADPKSLRDKIDKIASGEGISLGLTKSDVSAIVEAALGGLLKTFTEEFKKHKADVKSEIKSIMDTLGDIGACVTESKGILDKALSGGDDETEIPETPAPKTKKGKASAGEKPEPETRLKSKEYIAYVVGDGNCKLDSLMDRLVKNNYIKAETVPEDREDFRIFTRKQLRSMGYAVDENDLIHPPK